MALSATERLKKLGQSAKKVEPKSKSKSIRQIPVPEVIRQELLHLCELAAVNGILNPQFEAIQKKMKEEFLKIYCKEMWSQKACPENWKAVILNKTIADACCNGVFKFRDNALVSKFRGEVPEDKTLADIVLETIEATTGLSQENAKKFFDSEIVIQDRFTFVKPLEQIAEMEDSAIEKRALNKWFNFLEARPSAKSKNNEVKVVSLTDEEYAALFVISQEVYLKGDVETRIWTYCESEEQLLQLLQFCSVTVVISNFEFGISDSPKVKSERMRNAVEKYIMPPD